MHQAQLLTDKLSGKPPEKGKPFTKYGSKGEIVTIINWHDSVAILEGKNGRFSAKKEELKLL